MHMRADTSQRKGRIGPHSLKKDHFYILKVRKESKMVRKCFVPDCPMSQTRGIPMFELPRDIERRKAWLQNMRADDIDSSRANLVVCLLHFEDQYLIDHGHRVTLTKDAVPTILKPDTSGEESFECSPSTSGADPEAASQTATIMTAEYSFLSQEQKPSSAPGTSHVSPSKGQSATSSPIGMVAKRYLRLSQQRSSSAASSQQKLASAGSSQGFLGGSKSYSPTSRASDETFCPDTSPKRRRLEEARENTNHLSEDGTRVFLVSEAQLRLLLRRCMECGQLCDTDCALFSLGVDIRAEQHCKDCSTRIWRSFPATESSAIHQGNFNLTAATIFAGNTYQDLESISANLNLQIMSRTTFYRYSTVYVYDTVDSAYLERESNLYEGVRLHQAANPSSGLRLAMDGRFSRPGFTATYGLITALDLDRNRIIACHLRKKNDADVSSSSDMETVGTKTVLKSLQNPCGSGTLPDELVAALLISDDDEAAEAWEQAAAIEDPNPPAPIRVAAVVTDDSSAVTKMMKTNFPEIRHDGDPWHVAKAVRKRLSALAAKASTREIGYWSEAIVNFLWTAMKTCNGDGELLLEQWRAVAFHVFDVHEWSADPSFSKFTQCQHPPEYAPAKTLYLLKHTPAYKAIEGLVNDADLQRRIFRCRNFMQTAAVENFHSVLLKFVPKRLHFSDRAFAARSKLAVMDWEANFNMGPRLNAEGKVVFSLAVPPSVNDWRIKRAPIAHSYQWSKDLMTTALGRAIEASLGGRTMADYRSVIPEKSLVSAHVRPNRLTLLERDYRRRYGELDDDDFGE